MMEVNSKSGSNLTKVIWRIETLNAVGDSNGGVTKVTWRIQNFSRIKGRKLCSENFAVGGNKWNIVIYPKGDNNNDHLSVYLDVADSATLPSGWTRFAHYGLAVIDQIDRRNSITKVASAEFKAKELGWGFTSFLARIELNDPKRGYLLNDACLVEVYISTDKTGGLISRELILKTDLDKHETEETDRVTVKAAVDNQKTDRVTITIPPPTRSSCPTVAGEPEVSTEEDMKTFFSSLESELSSSKTVFSRKEAKEALAKVEAALNLTPYSFYLFRNCYPLEKAFIILASFDCSPTTLTIEQKNVLLAMDESIKELAGRADKAKQTKEHFTEKESNKLTLTHTLDHNVTRYMEVESEVKQMEQKLAALHKQVEEAQKKMENMLGEREGIYRRSKEMKVELDALGKEWSEYEANAKVAEEEAKTVEAEWGRMKRFISSIKHKYN